MIIIGVIHEKQYLDTVEKYLLESCQGHPDSLMVELPPNYSGILKEDHLNGNDFFGIIARRFEQRGSRIIYGDLEKKIPITFIESLVAMYTATNPETIARRNEGLARSMRDENPSTVLVGGIHADFLVNEFSNTFYVAFLQRNETSYKPNNPDEIIYV